MGATSAARRRRGGSRRGRTARLLLGVLVMAWPGSTAAVAAPEGAPFVRVLGTAQDGGLPHAACSGPHCERARADPSFARRIAALAIVLPASGRVFLVDATPDLRRQLDMLRDVRDEPEGRVDRAPVDGVILTHAHIGHYLGLAFFGFEAVDTSRLPVWATPRMAAFLRGSGPWSQLVSKENVEVREVAPGGGVELGDGVRIELVAVPHRDEFSDTVGVRIVGPHRTLLYVPDTDSWERWRPPLGEALEGVDVAILDGTFYSLDELPGRDLSSVPHPLITDTVERLGEDVRAGGIEVLFTHLNHSNPALDPEGPERRRLDVAGFRVLSDGEELGL